MPPLSRPVSRIEVPEPVFRVPEVVVPVAGGCRAEGQKAAFRVPEFFRASASEPNGGGGGSPAGGAARHRRRDAVPRAGTRASVVVAGWNLN